MTDSAERVRMEELSRIVEEMDWADPADCQSSFFTLDYDKKEGTFHVAKGIVKMNDYLLIERGKEVVVADVRKKELVKVEGVDLGEVKHNEVLDLSVEGDRWEGDVLNARPCGWGILYDKEGRRGYEGFRVGDVNVCYGRNYDPDTSKVEYEGGLCDGMRWGCGIQYDRNGDIVYDGEWLSNDHLEKRVVVGEEMRFHNHIEELVVSSGCGNGEEWDVLDLSGLKSLKSLKIGDDCFEDANEVKLVGLKELEKVVIGTNSFTKSKGDWSRNPLRRFVLKNCPSLRELKMGRFSFSDCSEIEIGDVDALEVIEMGELNEWSFNFAPASFFELKSLLVESE